MTTQEDNIFTSIYKSFNALNRRTVSVAVLILFLSLTIAGLMIHEPTFDESKAWLISRDSSFGDLISYIPHYEGHPPFWHLLLAIPAKCGIAFEVGLKTVQFISSALLISVFLFLMPFNNTVRAIVPFTYFFLVRYNIYSRPYALLLAFILLAAYFYGKRREKPLPLILSLAGMCLWSLYGIAIAGGIAIAWIIEIIMDLVKEKKSFSSFFSGDKKRTAGFIVLLLLACFLLFLINPYKDNFVFENNRIPPGTFVYRWILFIFTAPSESLFSSFYNDEFFYSQTVTPLSFIICALISSAFYLLLILRTNDKSKLICFFIPYSLYSFISTVYTSTHHFGIILFLLLFYFAICSHDEKKENRTASRKVLKLLSLSCAVIFIFMGFFWSLSSLLTESFFATSSGREISNWIISADIKDSCIHSAWHVVYGEDGSVENVYPAYGSEIFINAAPYFDDNILANPVRKETFTVAGGYSQEETDQAIKRLKESDAPEFIFSSGSQNAGDYIKFASFKEEYLPVFTVNESLIFKDKCTNYLGGEIFCRKDLLDRYGLKELSQAQ